MAAHNPQIRELSMATARAVRLHGPDADETKSLRQRLAVAQLEEYVPRVLAKAPPLSDEQCQVISRLFMPPAAQHHG